MRCPYCHNPDLVLEPASLPNIRREEVLAFLAGRKGLLDGVCITGGEPTLQEEIGTFIDQIKELGFKVKLDTNGSNPQVLGELLKSGLIDYAAMDIKAPLSRYRKVTRSLVNPDDIQASIDLLMTGDIDYEFRTTVVPEIITEVDLLQIAELLTGAGKYVLQQYRPYNTLDAAYEELCPYAGSRLKQMAVKVADRFVKVEVRGS